MSMILDALKRADQERRRQTTELPSLVTEHTPPARRHSRQRGLLIAAVLLLAGAAMGLALASLRSAPGEEGTNTPSASRPVEKVETPSANHTEPKIPQPVSTTDERDLTPTAIARLYQREQAAVEVPEQEITQLYRDERHRPEPEPDAQTVSLPPPRPSRGVRLAEEPPEPTPEASPAPSPKPEPATARAEPEPPGIRALPWSFQQNIPSLNYQAHHYREGQNSSVVINQRERQAGDEVVKGVRIERIEADGLVLNYKGETFKLKALNSWVNM